MAFNAKNLSYELKEPTFLRKLKSQYGGDSVRHERPLARPRKAQQGDVDDEPVYVDIESQHTMTKAEYEALARDTTDAGRGESSGEHPQQVSSELAHDVADAAPAQSLPASHMVDVGTRKKRKAARVIDDTAAPDGESETLAETSKVESKPGKRKKKTEVKLSFDEET